MGSPVPFGGLPLMRDSPLTGISCADGDGFAVGHHLTDSGPDIASIPANDADSGTSVAEGDYDDDAVMTTTTN